MNGCRRRALLVGVDSHQYDGWTPLPYVRNDIEGPEGLYSILTQDLGTRCFLPDDIHRLLGSDATSDSIETILQRICITEAVEDVDEVFFYFSGHGIIHKTVDLPLLVTYETNPNSPHKSGLTIEWLRGLANSTKARLFVVIDACFSGRMITDAFSDEMNLAGDAATRLTELPRAAVFASCQAEELSGAAPGQTRSLFTAKLVDGLRGRGSALSSGRVTTGSLRDYLYSSMAGDAQEPSIRIPDDAWTLSIPHTPLGLTTSATVDNPWSEYLQATVLRYEESTLHARHAFAQLTVDMTISSPSDRGDGSYDTGPVKRKMPALNALEGISDAGGAHVAVVLGDVGSGKSTVLKRAWYQMAKSVINGQGEVIPVEVPLSLFRDIRFDEVLEDDEASKAAFEVASSKFRALLTDLMQYNFGIPLVWTQIENEVRAGKVAFFFDGLDEMGIDSRYGTILNSLRILCRFAELGALVVVSCRTHFLRDDDELNRALQRAIRGAAPYSIQKLDRFTQTQVTQYIDLMSESAEAAERCHEFLSLSFRGSRQLAQRPFLLEILVRTAGTLVDDTGQAVPETLVFSRFLDGWLLRDRWRFSRFLSDYRDAVERDVGKMTNPAARTGNIDASQSWAEQTVVYFIELLANDLRIEEREDVSYREIPNRIRAKFPTMPEVFLNFFEYTLRTCSFLVRDTSGSYKFLHKSIHSYFAARAILGEIRRKHYPWDTEGRIGAIPHSLGKKPVDGLVQELLVEMMSVSDRDSLEKWARYTLSKKNPYTLRYLGGNSLVILSDMQKKFLAGWDLHETYICGVELRGIDLHGADLQSAVIDSVSLEDTDLSGAYLEGVQMNNVHLGGAKLTGVDVTNGTTVISNPLGLESAKDVPAAFEKIVVASSKGERQFPNIVADGCDMSLIDGGRFWMGAKDGDSETDPTEGPAHEVVVKPFMLDVHPVTNRQFALFVEANPDWGKEAGIARTGNVYYLSLWDGGRPPPNLLDHPVVYVNWHAAQAYAEWAGKRLPTEAEWEFALRDKKHSKAWAFPWGPSEDSIPEMLREKLKPLKPVARATYPVGTVSANSYRLSDMTGNVNEWVQDWFDPDYYMSLVGQVSSVPTGPPFGREKVLRGGSFLSHSPREFRCYFRRFLLPSNTNQDGGFRCAKDV